MDGKKTSSIGEGESKVDKGEIREAGGITSMSYNGETRVVYCSPEKLKKQPVVDETKEAIKKITGKYESPGNLLIKPGVTTMNMNLVDQVASVHTGYAMSDASSDISDATPSWSGSVGMPNNFTDGVTDQDLLQVEMFYRSHKTEVHVCKCLANLYIGSMKSSGGDKWEFFKTGIPVLVLNTGDHVRQRKLNIILAEKGTGFSLWKDGIDHLTKYTSPHSNFHTLHLSTDHTKQAGFSFDDSNAAKEFYGTMATLTSNPDDDLLNLSRSKKNKKKKEKPPKQKYKAPKKTDISQPCCFVHVTKLERPETFPPPPNPVNGLADMMNNQLTLARSESSEISEDSTSQSAASEH